MRSDICKIDKDAESLAAIFKECERVAEYNGLTRRQSLHLRLLCEEIYGMLPHIVDTFVGELWFDYEDAICKVNVSLKMPDINSDKKKALIALSSNGKNASAVGIVGKIRNVIENYLLNEAEYTNSFITSSKAFYVSAQMREFTGYSYTWSLGEYKTAVNREDQPDAWDELEKSVIASVADDVIVGVKGNQADIIIVKKFA